MTFMLAFGHNVHGQLGIGSDLNATLPTVVPLPAGVKPRYVAASADVTAVLTCCGRLLFVGGTRAAHRGVFTEVRLPDDVDLNDAVGIAATATTIAIGLPRQLMHVSTRSDAAVSTTALPGAPHTANDETIKAVSAGALFAAVLTTRGRVYATGMNAFFALGVAGMAETATATQLELVEGIDEVRLLQCGGCHVVAVRDDGSVFGWGRNHLGQLGQLPPSVSTPTLIPDAPSGPGIISVACGDYQTLFVSQRGVVHAAGANQCGQLGLPRCTSVTTFTAVPLSSPCTAVASGGGYNVGHSLFATDAGVFAAGSNSAGQLGSVLPPAEGSELRCVPNTIATPNLRLACGWRHSVLWDGTGRIETRVSRLTHTTLNASATTGRFATLIADACELIVLFLGPTRHVLYLGQTCREWHYHVQHSVIWRARLNSVAPDIGLALTQQLDASRAKGEYSAAVNWQSPLSDVMAERERIAKSRASMITNFAPAAATATGPVGLLSRIANVFTRSRPECRMLMLGLDAAGKTTMLYKLKLGEVVTTIPTIGFNVESVQYKDTVFTCWDVGGPDKIRPLWRHYFQDCRGVFFVVDSNDRDRIWQARDELHQMLREKELANAVLCVIANKQDLPNAWIPGEVADRLGLHAIRNHKWCIQGCVASSGVGLFEALDWTMEAIRATDNSSAA